VGLFFCKKEGKGGCS